jgi:hypothetical protein
MDNMNLEPRENNEGHYKTLNSNGRKKSTETLIEFNKVNIYGMILI